MNMKIIVWNERKEEEERGREGEKGQFTKGKIEGNIITSTFLL